MATRPLSPEHDHVNCAEHCRVWHPSPPDAARMFSELVDDPPQPADLVGQVDAPVSEGLARAAGSGHHKKKTDLEVDPGVIVAEELLDFADAVATRLLEEERWQPDHKTAVSDYCWGVLESNERRRVYVNAYLKGLEERRADPNSKVRARKPQYCSDTQAAKRFLDVYSGSPIPAHPLMRMMDCGKQDLGFRVARKIVKQCHDSLPLRHADPPNCTSRIIALAYFGWEHLSLYNRALAVQFVVGHESEVQSLAAPPEIIDGISEAIKSMQDEIQQGAEVDVFSPRPRSEGSAGTRRPPTSPDPAKARRKRQRVMHPLVLRDPLPSSPNSHGSPAHSQ